MGIYYTEGSDGPVFDPVLPVKEPLMQHSGFVCIRFQSKGSGSWDKIPVVSSSHQHYNPFHFQRGLFSQSCLRTDADPVCPFRFVADAYTVGRLSPQTHHPPAAMPCGYAEDPDY